MTVPSSIDRSSSAVSHLPSRILIVDDEAYICEILSRWLGAVGYRCTTALSAEKAWELLQHENFSLLVSDIIMPGKSGVELLSQVKERFKEEVAVIMVTAVDDRAMAIQALELGAYGYIIKPFDQNEFLISVANALERRHLVLERQAYEHQLEEEVRERTADVHSREAEIVLRLMTAAEYRDDETGAHIRRIGMYASALAEAIGQRPEEIRNIRLAAPMHDIGKIGVPDAILLKPGRLTPREFDVVKTHTDIGARILGESRIPLLLMARRIALSHHEKWDGSGYPQGLAKKEIPKVARAVAIADVYDALVTDRIYRPAFPEAEALAVMAKEKGRSFDPDLFELFLSLLPKFRQIRGSMGVLRPELPGGIAV